MILADELCQQLPTTRVDFSLEKRSVRCVERLTEGVGLVDEDRGLAERIAIRKDAVNRFSVQKNNGDFRGD